jgi:hypothetical protein
MKLIIYLVVRFVDFGVPIVFIPENKLPLLYKVCVP